VLPNVGVNDEPEVRSTVWVVLNRPGDAKVIVYVLPGVPNTPRLVNVTIPDEALCAVVPRSTPPLETVAVTIAFEVATVFPVLS
jgi:hypothetical protein